LKDMDLLKKYTRFAREFVENLARGELSACKAFVVKASRRDQKRLYYHVAVKSPFGRRFYDVDVKVKDHDIDFEVKLVEGV